jgi:antitoxin VapB
MAEATAKVFMSGRSQAVRIPRSFRFKTERVSIVRKGVSLLLTPLPRESMTWDSFFKTCACPDFVLDRSESQQGQERRLFE